MEQHRYERVLIETPRHSLEGTITLQRDGYRSRVSDVLNASEKDFVALTDVVIRPLTEAGEAVHRDLVIVARAQILLAIPLSEQRDAAPAPTAAHPAAVAPAEDGPSHPPPPLQSV